MTRAIITAILTALLSQTGFGAENELSDTVLRRALETGRSLVVVRIISVRAETERAGKVYYYKAKVRKVIIAGDLAPEAVKDPLDLFAGASYGKALTVGADYVLFIMKDAPHYVSWANRNDVMRMAFDDVQSLKQLETRAGRIYAKTSLHTFREPEDKSAANPPAIPQGLKDTCANFRARQKNRCELAEAIWKSDMGSRRDESRSLAAWVSYLRPKVQLSRAQILELLGKPTVKVGYTYKWFCGKDPQGHAGVLAVRYDPKAMVSTLVYSGELLNHWVKEEKAPTASTKTTSSSTRAAR